MERMLKNATAGFLLGMLLCLTITPSHALSTYYTRGTGSALNQNQPQRFHYTDPFYNKRITPPKTECKALGQARCLTSNKKPNPYATNRKSPAAQKTKVHPYVRKVFKPSIQRIN
jgi:hypothetical protein